MASIELESLQTVRDSPLDISTGSAPGHRLEASNISTEQLIHADRANNEAKVKGVYGTAHASMLRSSALVLMITVFATGSAISLSHHLYYLWLNGRTVGSTTRQQWALRLGNTFAFLAKCCFCRTTQIACTQWLWKTLRREYISIQGIDAAFSANETALSFFNLEMLLKMRTLTLLALVAWCILIIALVTPATLSVTTASVQDVLTAPVPVPIIPRNLLVHLPQPDLGGSVEASSKFFNTSSEALSRWASLKTDESGSVVIDDVSPRFSEMILSTATTGQLFSIAPPISDGNSTYSIDFIAPKILCAESSPDVARDTVTAAIRFLEHADTDAGHFTFNASGVNFEDLTYSYEEMSPGSTSTSSSRSSRIEQIGYYALIPFEGSSDDDASSAISFEDSGYRAGERNELQLVIGYREPDTDKTISTFLTCQLWNASWTMNVSTENNIQTVQVSQTTLLNKVDEAFDGWSLPTNPDGPIQLNLNKAVYTVFFRGVAKHLLGYMGRSDSRGVKNTVRASDIRGTVLTGSIEYAKMLRSITPMYYTSAAASHKHLKTMIEEFSENVTFNFMTQEFFSTRIERPITRVRSMNVYTYEPSNLVLAYCIAAMSSLVTIVIGVQAIRSNGVDYCLNTSTIIRTTQNPDIKDVVGNRTMGSQPLADDIAKTKLRFGKVLTKTGRTVTAAGAPSVGFGVEGTVSGLPKQS